MNTGSGDVAEMKESLLLHVRFHQLDPLLRPAGEPEVLQGDIVHREDGAGGAVLGRHVPNGGTISQRQAAEPGTVELHELAHHALSPKQLGDGEDQVGGGGTLGQPAFQPEADHFGDQHRDRLAQHRRLCFDPSDAPPQNAEAVDHRGMGVGADQRVRIRLGQPAGPGLGVLVRGEHHSGEVLPDSPDGRYRCSVGPP